MKYFKSYKLIFFILFFIASSTLILKDRFLYKNDANSYLIAKDNFNESMSLEVGRDFYAQLANSFIQKKTYLLPKYPDGLLEHPDPYSADIDKKLFWQDGSWYRDKYFIYWGPAPTIFYILPKVFFDILPSDILVKHFLMLFSILLGFILSLLSFKSKTFLGHDDKTKAFNLLVIFSLIYFNAIPSGIFYADSIHTVSRLSAIISLLMSQILFLYYLNEKVLSLNKVLIVSCLICFSAGSKFNFLVIGFLFNILIFFLIYKKLINIKWSITNLILIMSPLVITCSILLFYNYIRFDDPFEFGIKYMTNTLDYYSKSNELVMQLDLKMWIKVTLIKIYEYFFALPNVRDSLSLYGSTHLWFKAMPRSYAEGFGFVGIFIVCPVAYLIIKQTIQKLFSLFKKNLYEVFKDLNLILFLYFLIIFVLQIFTIFYGLPYVSFRLYATEIIMPIALIFISFNFNYSENIVLSKFYMLSSIYSFVILLMFTPA